MTIELRLAPDLVPAVVEAAPEPATAARLLEQQAGVEPRSPLLSTASWYALTITVASALPEELAGTGELASGYATIWATEHHILAVPMLTTLGAVFDEYGWSCELLEDGDGYTWRMGTPRGEWSCVAVVDELDQRLTMYSTLDGGVSEARRPEAAITVARVNAGLKIGNWELDLDDGDLRFKTSIDVAGDRLTMALARRVIERNLDVVDDQIEVMTGLT